MSIFAKAKKARENKKGFTLVELIVVLVILAILAAVLVPTLLGWIEKARNEKFLNNANAAYVAAQGLADEAYGQYTAANGDLRDTKVNDDDIADLTGIAVDSFTTTITWGGGTDPTDKEYYQITGFKYHDNDTNKDAVWTDTTGTWVIE